MLIDDEKFYFDLRNNKFCSIFFVRIHYNNKKKWTAFVVRCRKNPPLQVIPFLNEKKKIFFRVRFFIFIFLRFFSQTIGHWRFEILKW